MFGLDRTPECGRLIGNVLAAWLDHIEPHQCQRGFEIGTRVTAGVSEIGKGYTLMARRFHIVMVGRANRDAVRVGHRWPVLPWLCRGACREQHHRNRDKPYSEHAESP